jgi:hypothetical protein
MMFHSLVFHWVVAATLELNVCGGRSLVAAILDRNVCGGRSLVAAACYENLV